MLCRMYAVCMPYEGGKNSMSDRNFDLIAHEILKQKQRKELLEGENHELRKQLADLRTGRGIFVEIEGRRFALTHPAAASTSSINQESVSPLDTFTHKPQPSASSFPVAANEMEQQTSSLTPTNVMNTGNDALEIRDVVEESETQVTKELEMSATATAHPSLELTEEDIAPSFLEEAMIDEFASASTSPLSVWSGPVTPQTAKKPEEIADEEKAALRRQLIDSFLLG